MWISFRILAASFKCSVELECVIMAQTCKKSDWRLSCHRIWTILSYKDDGNMLTSLGLLYPYGHNISKRCGLLFIICSG